MLLVLIFGSMPIAAVVCGRWARQYGDANAVAGAAVAGGLLGPIGLIVGICAWAISWPAHTSQPEAIAQLEKELFG